MLGGCDRLAGAVQRVLLAEERVVRDDAGAGARSTPNAMPEARISLLQIDAAATEI